MTLEERVARLERELPRAGEARKLSSTHFIVAILLAAGATCTAYYGLGWPNHPYQGALGILTVALAYHRRWLRFPAQWHHWVVAAFNAVTLAMLFKLLIGSGVRQPFHWAKYPSLNVAKSQGKWFEVVPDWNVAWLPTPLASWQLDLTIIQTFLLLITLVGALFRFQPFVSLTAFFLVVVSLPAFSEFNWAWVFPSLVLAAIAFYVQSNEGESL